MQNRISKTVEWLTPWLTMQQHSQHDTRHAPLAVVPSPPLLVSCPEYQANLANFYLLPIWSLSRSISAKNLSLKQFQLNFIINNFFERSIKCSLWKSTVVECAYVICTSVKRIFENEQPHYHSDLVIKLAVSFSNKIILLFFLFIPCRSSTYYPDTALSRAIVTGQNKKNPDKF